MPEVLQSIHAEMEMRSGHDDLFRAKTLYFGGGTPSIVPPEAIQRLIDAAANHFHLEGGAEITLEANPDDINPASVEAWKNAGVNRLSIGIQSFRDSYLKWMNRSHNAKMAREATALALEGGVRQVSIDLIYGLPNLSLSEWEEELETALQLGARHISAYCLTVEPRTALGHMVRKGKEKPVDEDAAADQFALMVERFAEAGIQQYEVSNFARPGHESRHNSSYWRGEPYLGLGPAAHGFVRGNRYWNIDNNAQYIRAITEGNLPQTIEHLTDKDRYNEWVMTGLRMREGISLDLAGSLYGVDFHENFAPEMTRVLKSNLATLEGERLRLTTRGMFMADGIAARFFL